MKAPLSIGRVRGHRGNAGELTVVVASGQAARWEMLDRFLLGDGSGGQPVPYDVEESRAYRDRLILKLKGVNDPDTAAGLKGLTVWVAGDAVPPLPEGEYYLERLIGMTVREDGQALGVVTDVHEAGGTHVLVVETDSGGEILIPLVQAMVKEVETTGSSIHVVLPPGLKELDEGGRE
jgi:16S rRNA processing protein RimM